MRPFYPGTADLSQRGQRGEVLGLEPGISPPGANGVDLNWQPLDCRERQSRPKDLPAPLSLCPVDVQHLLTPAHSTMQSLNPTTDPPETEKLVNLLHWSDVDCQFEI